MRKKNEANIKWLRKTARAPVNSIDRDPMFWGCVRVWVGVDVPGCFRLSRLDGAADRDSGVGLEGDGSTVVTFSCRFFVRYLLFFQRAKLLRPL